MKYPAIVALVAILACAPCAAEDTPELSDPNDRINYSLGYQIGGDLRRQQVEVSREALLQGIEDAVNADEPRLSKQEMQAMLVELKRKVVAVQREERAAQEQKNLEAGEAFLAENARKDGVVSLPSGLQYRVVEAGAGRQPKAADTVTVHYRGTLIDGTEFDSSYSRKQPATFRVDHRRLARGAAADAGRCEVGAVHTRPTGLWQAWIREDSALKHAAVRGGTALGRRARNSRCGEIRCWDRPIAHHGA